jgi:hypothetical protein
MHGQQNDKYTEMHGQQNDKYTEMHGKQNDKYTEMHGQQNIKICLKASGMPLIVMKRTVTILCTNSAQYVISLLLVSLC